MPLKHIFCPACGEGTQVAKMRLVTKTGFSTIKCGNGTCSNTSVSTQWRCRCRLLWTKCPRHVHAKESKAVRQVKPQPLKKALRKAAYGVDRPLPKSRNSGGVDQDRGLYSLSKGRWRDADDTTSSEDWNAADGSSRYQAKQRLASEETQWVSSSPGPSAGPHFPVNTSVNTYEISAATSPQGVTAGGKRKKPTEHDQHNEARTELAAPGSSEKGSERHDNEQSEQLSAAGNGDESMDKPCKPLTAYRIRKDKELTKQALIPETSLERWKQHLHKSNLPDALKERFSHLRNR